MASINLVWNTSILKIALYVNECQIKTLLSCKLSLAQILRVFLVFLLLLRFFNDFKQAFFQLFFAL